MHLAGEKLMKCGTCSAENRAGANLCNTCGAALTSKCARCGFENPPGAKFCNDCGAWMGEAAAAGEARAPAEPDEHAVAPREVGGERRHLTVLFADLVGSTELSQRFDPEDYREIVRGYHQAAEAVVARFGGHIAQYLGDGVVVYFGWPLAHGDDAERAIRAGLALLDALAELNHAIPKDRRIAARIGVHTGPVVIGEIGVGSHREIAALGATPNVAARVQALGEPNSILMTAATNQLAAGLFITEDLGAQAMKGIAQPIEVYRVRQPSGVRSRLQAAAARGLTPFVGREHERRLLQERWGFAEKGDGQIVLISGEPGIGKSRLVGQFREDLSIASHTWIEAFCSPYSQDTPFASIIELLNQLLAWRGDESEAERLAALERVLWPTGLKLEEAVPLVAALLDLRVPERYPALQLPPAEARKRLMATLTRWLEASARTQPLVMMLEDLQWADPSTLELQELLVERAATAPMMLLYTARPEFQPVWPVPAHHTQVVVERLNPAQTRELVERVAVQTLLREDLLQAVVARTGGVPLFVEELTKTLAEPGRATVSEHEIPDTLKELLIARLDRLDDAKEIAQVASVIGREFSYAMLEAIAGRPEAELRAALSRVVDAELVHVRGIAPEASYVFKHALVQDTAYESLLRSRRRELHRAVARTLTEKFPDAAEAGPELVAQHLSEAGDTEPAVAAWQRAGKRAGGRGAMVEAERHYIRALDLLSALPDTPDRGRHEFGLQTALGMVLWGTKGWSVAQTYRAFARAQELGERLGETGQLVAVLSGLWTSAVTRGQVGTAQELADRLLRAAERSGERAALCIAHHRQGHTLCFRGELEKAKEHLDLALDYYDEADFKDAPVDIGILALSVVAAHSAMLGFADRARQVITRTLRLAERRGNPFSLGYLHLSAVAAYVNLRDPQATLEHAEALRRLAGENPVFAGYAEIWGGWASYWLGKNEEGLARMRRGMAAYETAGFRVNRAWELAAMAVFEAREGRLGDALAAVTEALQAAEEVKLFKPNVLLVRADLVIRSGAPAAEIEVAYRDAIECARGQSNKLYELEATAHFARWLRAEGRVDEARPMLSDIYNWFTEGFDTHGLKDAKALLEELSVCQTSA
jgi:class 3 adenylate cyclase/tetratricopeptide (TPR) repeat protein